MNIPIWICRERVNRGGEGPMHEVLYGDMRALVRGRLGIV